MFVTFPARAHVHNVVPLAWACQLRGHEVRVAGHPDVLRAITGAGLVGVPIGGPGRLHDGAERRAFDPAVLDATSGFSTGGAEHVRSRRDFVVGALALYLGAAAEHGGATADLVTATRRWEPDLVVWDQMSFCGPVAAQACGAAHARLLFGMDHAWPLRERFRRDAGSGFDLAAELVAAGLRRFGADGPPDPEEMLFGRWTVDPVPAAMQVTTTLHRLPLRPVAYTGTTVLDGTDAPSDRVCLTFGMAGREIWGTEYVDLRAVVEAVAEVGAPVVATLGPAQVAEIGPWPGNVRVVEFVPLAALLPTCAAVVHRGGLGTFAAAAAARLPQVVVPGAFWDEEDVGRLVADRGAGVLVDGADAATTLGPAVRAVLSGSDHRAGAARLADDLATAPAPDAVVAELERLVAASCPTAAGVA